VRLAPTRNDLAICFVLDGLFEKVR
jgi:hypothetical protein